MKYLKMPTESSLGVGTVWLELDGEWVVRQVDNYGARWFSSREDFHPALGILLTDQPLPESEHCSYEEVTRDEFEQVWTKAAKEDGEPSG